MDANPFPNEVYISVDIETAGPNPSEFSLLTIGACSVYDSQQMFYVELQPVNPRFVTGALAISKLSMERLSKHGQPAKAAMQQFEDWILKQAGEGQKPVFVAFNAAFDWMFVNDYFHRFLGRNPFGHTALDIKSLYMGLTGVPWEETTKHYLVPRYMENEEFTHHALRDAMDQAQIFRKILEEARLRAKGEDI